MKQTIFFGLLGIVLGAVYFSVTNTGTSPEIVSEEASSIKVASSTKVEIIPGITIDAISHASAVLTWGDLTVYADPVGSLEQYAEQAVPDVIFITHRHGDHLNIDNLAALMTEATTLLAPNDVVTQLSEDLPGEIMVLGEGETTTITGVTFEAVPAYNTRVDALDYHPRERGDNGYVLSDGTSRVYFSGDSEDVPEMRALENIDVAFVAMNLPFTMSVEAAADAVATFAPKVVYPYHYRTRDGLSDVTLFKKLVTEMNADIEVVQLDWYPEV